MLYRLAFFFVFVTGFTGLVYQVTWHKYLSFYLGSHAMATSLVLAVFFLFLSLGYMALGRNIHRIPIRDKLFVYGIIEALIGFYALVSPELFEWMTTLLPAGGQSQTTDFVLGFVFTTLFIGAPTFLMGTTIPVLTQALSRDFDTAHGTHAAVYGLNTLGAVFGGLLTGFVLIDVWGLPLTLLNTGLVNLAIGFITYLMHKHDPQGFAGVEPDASVQEQTESGGRGWILVLYTVSFASGFYVFSLENLMIRVAGLTIGSSSYTFAMIVAAFILGIALGSLWVGRRKIQGASFFVYVQAALLISVLGLYFIIPSLPEWLARIRVIFLPSYMNIPLYWTAVFAAFTAVLLIPVSLMGMNLPLIFNYLRSRGAFLSQTVGRVYAINTAGSVLGSLIGGYLLFFVLEWDGVFRFNLALIVVTLLLLALLAGGRVRRAGVGAATVMLVGILAMPGWPDSAFLPSPALINRAPPTASSLEPTIEDLRDNIKLEFVYEGPSAHVGVIRFGDGEPQLHINGNPNTGGNDWELRAMNAVYPLSFVDQPESAFVVGLGAGLSSSIFAEIPSMQEVVVAEIAIGAIKALPYFDRQNADFTEQPYFDKVEFVPADAIQVLRSTDRSFDIIVSEPNHPWVAGVENLFTREFLTKVRDRLTDDGVYCQWFPLFGSEPDTVLSILKTFQEVFPEVRAFSTGGSVLSLVAAKRPLNADLERIRSVYEYVGERFEERGSAFARPEFLLATEVMTDWALRSIVAEYPAVHTFEFPVVASSAFRAKFAGIGAGFRRFITSRLHTSPPAGQASAQMLYERVRAQLDAEFFSYAYENMHERGPIGQAVVPRLWYHRTSWFDSDPVWPEGEQRALLAYVAGRSDAIPETLRTGNEKGRPGQATLAGMDESAAAPDVGGIGGPQSVPDGDNEPDSVTLAIRLFNTYRWLIQTQVPGRLNRVVDAMPDTCDTTRCSDVQRAILVESMGGEQAAGEITELDLGEADARARIQQNFEQLRTELEAGR